MTVALQLQSSLPWSSEDKNQITTSDIQSIRSAENLNEVSNIWAKIADFFCGRHKEEAKEILFKLIHESVTPEEQLKLFERLQDITPEAYQYHVQSEVEGGGVATSTKLTITSPDTCKPIFQRVVQATPDSYNGQFKASDNQVYGGW